METTLIFVRHGETDWNRLVRYRGRVDIPLNSIGMRQAELTAKYIAAHWKPVCVYSSPLSRALSTAQDIANECRIVLKVDSGLSDTNYGEWQGLTPGEVNEKWPGSLSKWFKSPHLVKFPGGETLSEVRNRARNTVNQLAIRHEGAAIVLVSHTDVIRLIMMSLLGIGLNRFWRLRQDNCAISLVGKTPDGFVIRSMNCVTHLEDLSTEVY